MMTPTNHEIYGKEKTSLPHTVRQAEGQAGRYAVIVKQGSAIVGLLGRK